MAWSAWALPALVDPRRAPAGYRTIPAQDVGGRREENAPAVGQPRDAQAITEVAGKVEGSALFASRRVVMSDAFDFLTKWVRKNITSTTAHIHNDTLTAGRLAEECLWAAQSENLSEAEVNEAASGNLLTFMILALNRAAEQKTDEEGE
jgi:hypothetical protein